jgi:hypothetical protein
VSSEARDIAQVFMTADLPVRARALPFADRLEPRFGKAFPVALVTDRAALPRLIKAIEAGQMDLDSAGGGR